MENPFREALLMASLYKQDPDDSRAEYMAKYMKSLFNVHGTAICRMYGFKGSGIFSDDTRSAGGKANIKHVFTLDDGTVVKVMANA
jgi:predicted nucleic acid-binding Zn ribbon protein